MTKVAFHMYSTIFVFYRNAWENEGWRGVRLGEQEGRGVTLGAGGHQCTAAKLMPVFSPSSFFLCRHRKAECGVSLTGPGKHTET